MVEIIPNMAYDGKRNSYQILYPYFENGEYHGRIRSDPFETKAGGEVEIEKRVAQNAFSRVWKLPLLITLNSLPIP